MLQAFFLFRFQASHTIAATSGVRRVSPASSCTGGSRIGVAAAALLALGMASGCSKLTEPPAQEPLEATASVKPMAEASAAPKAAPRPKPTFKDEKPDPSLGIVDVKVGTGAVAKAGDRISVHYRGSLKADGKEFDASRPRGKPFTFQLGTGSVIKGWDQGVAGMKVGGTRKLTIPGALGYGARGSAPKIPPDATLLFDVELLDVKSGAEAEAPSDDED
jgi:FKBP-type peptidyl-prolyl cis-trans isomerase